MLILPIKKKWFDMILKKEKLEEYREIKPYYTSRFNNMMGKDIKIENNKVVFNVIFRNGYSKNSPQMTCKCFLRIGTGKQSWGAEQGKEYYILEILEILEVQNVK